MAFNDLQIKIASETAVMGLQRHMASLKFFAHDFKPTADRPFAGVQVPVYNLSAAADYDEETNNWAGGNNEVNGVVVGLDKHFIKSISLNDVQAGETDLNFLKDGSQAIADVLGRAANKYCYETIISASQTEGNVLTAMNIMDGDIKANVAGLIAECDERGINPYESVLVLSPAVYGKLMSTLDYSVIGSQEAAKYGVVENIYGFRAVLMSGYLNTPYNKIQGLVIPYGTVGIVSRLNKPAVDGYVNTWTAETDDGFTLGYRVHEDLNKGKMYLGADVLFGCKVLQPGIFGFGIADNL